MVGGRHHTNECDTKLQSEITHLGPQRQSSVSVTHRATEKLRLRVVGGGDQKITGDEKINPDHDTTAPSEVNELDRKN